MSLKHALQMHARVRAKRIIKSTTALAARVIPSDSPGKEKISVLMYHRINDYRKNDLSVSEKQFRKQVKWLRDNGYQNMKMSELETLTGDQGIDTCRVVFTFDDGYEDNFINAFPILREFGYTGLFYIPLGFIESGRLASRDRRETGSLDKNRRLTWDQISEMLSAGMEVGSHTVNHKNLTNISPEQAWQEIAQSKIQLEEKLGTGITSFCSPGGHFSQDHVRMIGRAGYRSATTASPGQVDFENLLSIPRLAVQASDSFFIFRSKMLGKMKWLARIR